MTEERQQGLMMALLLRVSRKIVIGLFLVWCVFALFPDLFWRFSRAHERRGKYQDAKRRIAAANGWEAIESACLTFATNFGPKARFDRDYYWRGKRLTTNELPPALEVLQPWRIQLKPDSNGVPTLRVKLFGIHRTGSYDEPYFGIWIICTNVSADYVPAVEWRDHGMRGLVERKGRTIFEVR